MKSRKKSKEEVRPGSKRKQARTGKIPWSLISMVLICLAGIIAYSNSFDCSFHFDDIPTLKDNMAIRNLASVGAWWSFYPTRPIGYLTFALNYYLHGLDVWGYHLVNLAIHIFNGLVVWWLVMLTMATPIMKTQQISRHRESIALFTALLFVSHPLATQSVTYISQRLASLATLFYLLSLALYVKGRLAEDNGVKQAYYYYAFCILCAVLGMLTKEIVFTLPFALVLYEFSFIKTDTRKIDLKDRGVQIPAIVLVLFLAFFSFKFSLDIFKPIPPLLNQGYDYPITAWEYFLTQFSVILTYIRLFILPVDQNLDYDYPISHSLLEMHTVFGLLSLSGIFLLGIFLFRRYRLIAFGIFWFFLTLSVESSIIPISQNVIFEHRTYLPSVGFFLALTGTVFYFLWDRYRQVAIGILSLMILTNTVLTFERNKVWKSDYTLWADSLKKSPNKPRPLSSYGVALAHAGNVSEALKYFDEAIKANPSFYIAYYNRGNAYISLGSYKQAIREFDRTIEINPAYADAYHNRGVAYKTLGNYEQASRDFSKAIEIDPTSADGYYNRGIAYGVLGNYEQAIRDFDRAIAINPKLADAYHNRGVAYGALGNHERAIRDFDIAIATNPTVADVYRNRAIAYEALRNHRQAMEDWKTASKLGDKIAQDFLRGQGIR